MSISEMTDQEDSDAGLFGPEIHDTSMSAGAALQTTIAGLSIGYIGMNRLVKTFGNDPIASAGDNELIAPLVVEKMTALLPSIKALAEWLEAVNHRVFGMCIHAPEMDGGILWNAIQLRVMSADTVQTLEEMLDMVQAQLN